MGYNIEIKRNEHNQISEVYLYRENIFELIFKITRGRLSNFGKDEDVVFKEMPLYARLKKEIKKVKKPVVECFGINGFNNIVYRVVYDGINNTLQATGEFEDTGKQLFTVLCEEDGRLISSHIYGPSTGVNIDESSSDIDYKVDKPRILNKKELVLELAETELYSVVNRIENLTELTPSKYKVTKYTTDSDNTKRYFIHGEAGYRTGFNIVQDGMEVEDISKLVIDIESLDVYISAEVNEISDLSNLLEECEIELFELNKIQFKYCSELEFENGNVLEFKFESSTIFPGEYSSGNAKFKYYNNLLTNIYLELDEEID